MLSCMKLQAWKTGMKKLNKFPENKHVVVVVVGSSSSLIRLPLQSSLPPRFSALSLKNKNENENSHFSFTSSVVGSPPSSSPLHLTPRHITLLNVLACTVAISTTWLFCSAIPTLLAFKRAAESLEKLLDVTREELPDTMAAVRLSGMEISDLTMELSDLGQEITQGVRSSTRAVRVAEERLRRLTNMSPSASLQAVVAKPKVELKGPVVATTARNIREGIVKGRAFFQIFLTLARYSRMTLNFFASRAKR